MSCGMISGGESLFHHCTKPNTTIKKTIPETSSHLFFKTHLFKSTISIKSQSGSFRTRTEAAIDNLYDTEEVTESFYDLLGISESGTLSEIKKAYKQLARKYHPDVSPPDRTEEYTKRFILVQEAYEILSDPNTKALYDTDLAKGFHLAFSARKWPQYGQRFEEGGKWRNRWEAQLVELKRRSESKDSRSSMSWAARMRRQRSQPL